VEGFRQRASTSSIPTSRRTSPQDGLPAVAKHFLEEKFELIPDVLLTNIIQNTILEEESGPKIRTQLPHGRRCPRKLLPLLPLYAEPGASRERAAVRTY
jgi:hypothetical protein